MLFHFRLGFPIINQPCWGAPHGHGNPHIIKSPCSSLDFEIGFPWDLWWFAWNQNGGRELMAMLVKARGAVAFYGKSAGFFFAQRAKRNTTSCSKMMQIDANWFTVSLRFLDSTFGFCMFLHLRSLCDFSGSDTDEMPLLSPDRLMWWDYWTSESWWQPPTAGAASNRWVFGVSAFKGAHMAASLLFQ